MKLKAVSRVLVVIVLIVIILLASVGIYFATSGGKSSTTTSSQQSSTISTSISSSSTSSPLTESTSSTSSTSSITSSSPTSSSSNTLVVEEVSQPDSMDPAVEFTTPGNEITSNVYQGLIAPYYSSNSIYVGALASNWTTSSNQMNWNFSLRQGVTFSNGDPFNAYVMWYSLYRTLVMNQVPAFILGQNFGINSSVNITDSILNSIDYSSPSSSNLTLMEKANQSFQVINQYEIALNLGYGYNGQVPYSALLATLTAPSTFAVDPKVVSANGGVVANSKNSWMQTNAIGTGFYVLNSWVQGQSVKLVKNRNYWADGVSAAQLNYAIQPAILNGIIIYYKPTSSIIADLKSGTAQILGAEDVSEISGLSTVQGIPNVNVTELPIQFGSAVASYFIFMNPTVNLEFNNSLVRAAVANAINYNGMINAVFSGHAQTWIGPIPPGFADYNAAVQGLTPYSYNATRAAEDLAKAGYQAKLPNGTILVGKAFPTLNFVYSPDLVSEMEAAPIIANELSAIGIAVNLVSMTFSQYTAYVFSTNTTGATNGFGIGYYSEDYFASQDFVTALASTNYIGAPVLYANESLFAANAAGATDNATLLQSYRNVTTTMLNSYNDVWLYVPVQLAVNVNNVVGMVANPTGSCAGYFMFYNTVHYT
jgi:peptide/nickel transport system substrate-binding protein